MKWRFSLIVLPIIVAVGALIIVAGRQANPEPVVRTATEVESGASYTIDAQYPQFGIAAIDASIREELTQKIDEIKKYPAPVAESATKANALIARYDHAYIGPDIVSVELIFSIDTGGAHPNTIISGLAFDRKTGKRLELNDALSLIGKSIAEVSASSSARFLEAFGEGFFSEGATADPENFSSFSIDANSVTFIFQQYQVAAYAAGPQRVSFPRIH